MHASNIHIMKTMRADIIASLNRMTQSDREDVRLTFRLESAAKASIRRVALADEDIAEYVLMY